MSIDQEHIDDFMYRTFGYKKPLAKAESLPRPGGDAMIGRGPRSRPPGGSGGSSATPKKRDTTLNESPPMPTPKPTRGSQPKPGVAYMDPEGKQEAPHFTSSRSEVPPWDARDDDKGLNMDVGPMLGGRRPVYPYGSWQEKDMADEFRRTGVIRPASAHDRSMAAVRHMATPQPHYETGEPITPRVSIRQMREAYRDPSNQRVMDPDDPRYDGSSNGYQSKVKPT